MSEANQERSSELKPGKELDNLVAVKVLGWRFSKSSFEQYEPSAWYKDGSAVWSGNFSPSTDIKAAWEVIEALRTPAKVFCLATLVQHPLVDGGGLKWIAKWEMTQPQYHFEFAIADTAPHAICLASLKALP